jgi:serine phosphatase RsbU (regulator of sigma subunit)
MNWTELWPTLAVAFWCLPLPILVLDYERRRHRYRLLQIALVLLLSIGELVGNLYSRFDPSGTLLRNLVLTGLSLTLAETFLQPDPVIRRRLRVGTAVVLAVLLALNLSRWGEGPRAATVLAAFTLASSALFARTFWTGIPVAAAAFCIAGGAEHLWIQVAGELALLMAFQSDVRATLRAEERERQRQHRERMRPGNLVQSMASGLDGEGEELSEDRLDTLLEFAQSAIRADGGALFHYREETTRQRTLSRRLSCTGARGRLAALMDDPQVLILAQLLLSRLAASGERVLQTGEPDRVDSLLLEQWRIDGFAAAVIRAQGRTIGLLVLSLPAGMRLDAQEKGLLEFLSQQAAFGLQYDQVYNRMVEQTRLVREFEIASRLQRSLLPADGVKMRNLDMAARMDAAREVGGDYYDLIPLGGDQMIAVMGDVTGKGLPAGMIMLITRTILHVLLDSQSRTSPAWLVAQLNARLWPQLDPMTYVSFLCLRWNAGNRSFLWSGAGHEHLLVLSALDRRVQRIRCGGLALGLRRDSLGEWSEQELFLAPGDVLLLYTDGVTEARDASGTEYGLGRLEESLVRHHGEEASGILSALFDDLAGHVGGGPPLDDRTMLVLKIH